MVENIKIDHEEIMRSLPMFPKFYETIKETFFVQNLPDNIKCIGVRIE